MAKKQAPMSLMDSETRNELAEFDLVQFVETRHSIKKAVVAAIVFAALAVALFLVGYFMAVRPEWFPIDLEVEGGLFAWALALFAALA
ncbi:MAG: hypothetical protein FWC73_04055, partial [Defluviitaleaceae bacterium]|nr:hypothetical protein [Defluviitaleaceae bacterium]